MFSRDVSVEYPRTTPRKLLSSNTSSSQSIRTRPAKVQREEPQTRVKAKVEEAEITARAKTEEPKCRRQGEPAPRRNHPISPLHAFMQGIDTDEPDPDIPFQTLPENRPLILRHGSFAMFRNKKRLTWFQAIDLGRLVAREKGERVCGSVNQTGYILAYDMGCVSVTLNTSPF